MSSSKFSNSKLLISKTPCRFGKKCTKFPNDCPYYHSPENTPNCPFIKSPSGCTNLKCPYRHPKGFVHACIFGAKCKRIHHGCPYTHPVDISISSSFEIPPPLPPRDTPIVVKQQSSENVWNCSKPFELSITSTSSVAELSEDDKYYIVKEENGSKYCINSEGIIVGVYNSDGMFTSFCPIMVDSSKPDYEKLTDKKNNDDLCQDEWNKMTDEYDPNSDDDYEIDPEAYEDDTKLSFNPDDYESDPKVYGLNEK